MADEIPVKKGTSPLIFLGVFLLLASAGLVYFKLQADAEAADEVPEVEEVTKPSAPATPPRSQAPAPPPPPSEEETNDGDPGDEASTAPARSVQSSSGGCKGSCTGTKTGALISALRGRAGMARNCYQTAVQNNPTLAGKMTATVRVSPSGSICYVQISGDTLGDPALSSCVKSRLSSAPLPRPQGGCVELQQPFNFKPAQ